MKKQGKRLFQTGIFMAVLFVLWTVLIRTVDVQMVGPMKTGVGFAVFNSWFHELTGVHMLIYGITDWLGLVPIFICMIFGMIGFFQMIKRKSLLKVDADLVLLGIYYIIVILIYFIFEMIPINYRPILIEGRLEASYPSSTTLLVLCVMPTLLFQVRCRMHNTKARYLIEKLSIIFSLSMVIGRLISGVHWITDIIGAILLSRALFCIYISTVLLYCQE